MLKKNSSYPMEKRIFMVLFIATFATMLGAGIIPDEK
jgi:hypothetical protein